jgi:hypothetical protein
MLRKASRYRSYLLVTLRSANDEHGTAQIGPVNNLLIGEKVVISALSGFRMASVLVWKREVNGVSIGDIRKHFNTPL